MEQVSRKTVETMNSYFTFITPKLTFLKKNYTWFFDFNKQLYHALIWYRPIARWRYLAVHQSERTELLMQFEISVIHLWAAFCMNILLGTQWQTRLKLFSILLIKQAGLWPVYLIIIHAVPVSESIYLNYVMCNVNIEYLMNLNLNKS